MKFIKYAAITIVALVVLVIAAAIIFHEDTPFATLEANGVTVEIYGQREAENLSSSATPNGHRITMDEHEVTLTGDGTLTVDGEVQDIGDAKKVSIRLKGDKLYVELE